MVKRVLKDNKVVASSTGSKAAEATSPGAGSATGFLAESQVGLCERPGACLDKGSLNRPGACLDKGSLNRRNFSKRKRENRGTQWLFRRLSAAACDLLHPHPLRPRTVNT